MNLKSICKCLIRDSLKFRNKRISDVDLNELVEFCSTNGQRMLIKENDQVTFSTMVVKDYSGNVFSDGKVISDFVEMYEWLDFVEGVRGHDSILDLTLNTPIPFSRLVNSDYFDVDDEYISFLDDVYKDIEDIVELCDVFEDEEMDSDQEQTIRDFLNVATN